VSDDDNPRLVTLMFEPGELQLLMGLLATDIDTMQNNVELAQSGGRCGRLLKARVVLAMSLHTAVSEAFYSVAPSITCPRCGRSATTRPTWSWATAASATTDRGS
jgi:hypothetical protein